MKTLIALTLAAALVGCSSTEEYKLYSNGQAQIETAKYNADAAKYAAMADIARSGTESAKVAAVMARAILGLQAAGVSEITWVLADNTPAVVTAAELGEALALSGAAQAAVWVI